ncbi:glycosyltransferase family 2 protein [Sutcliffiella cohnii]
MNQKPLVSVIIPAYNAEKVIDKTIESVLSQTFSDFEVIVVNDGSKDRTSDIVQKYTVKDIRVRLINQLNQGVSAARNKGIKEAKGSYISFLDSDDYYDIRFLEEMYMRIKSEDSDICYCGYNRVTPEGKSKVITKFQKNDLLKSYIKGRIRVHTSGWIIKKDLVDINGISFSEDLSWGEDFEFFCKVLVTANRFSYVEGYLTNYTVDFNEERLSSFSINKIDKDYESINKILENEIINKDNQTKKLLLNYRLSALITYRLLLAFKHKVAEDIILDFFNKYKDYIIRFNFNNGSRSLKLNISKLNLVMKIKRIK